MKEADFLWQLIIVLTAVGNLAGIGIAIWAAFKRTPPIPEELYKDFLSKADHSISCAYVRGNLAALDKHNTDTHTAIFSQIKQNQESIQDDFKLLERGLGRVEGKVDTMLNGKD